MAFILHSPTTPKQRSTPSRQSILWSTGAISLAAWVYLIAMAWGMENMDVSEEWALMPRMIGWGASDLLLVFFMWIIMMAAMMIPSTLPLQLMLGTIDQAKLPRAGAWRRTASFTLGYLTVWAGFSALATMAQWGLLEGRLISPMMTASSPYLSSILLILAGAYQFSPLKQACLRRCRSPLGFLLTQKNDSRYRLGLRHGAYCTGCCWLLMALLFILGVMNLWWILALTVLVLLEKLLPNPQRFAQFTGFIFILAGLVALGFRA